MKDSKQGSEALDDQSPLRALVPGLDEVIYERIDAYKAELLKFSRTLNLISPGTSSKVDAIHFADCVLAYEKMAPRLKPGVRLWDFGSGNGMPGLIIGIMNPALEIRLVERDVRKLEFCKHVADVIGAKNVTCIRNEVDNLPDNSVEQGVARAWAPMSRALLSCRRVMTVGGVFFQMKSDSWARELASLPPQLFDIWQTELLGSYRIPGALIDLSVIASRRAK